MKAYYISPLILQKLIWIPTRLVLKIFGRLHIKGLENVEGIKLPIIFACNHSSDIDPFLVPASLPFFSKHSPLFYAVREKSFYDNKGLIQEIFNEWFISLWGGYPARVGTKDYAVSLKKHIEILGDGGNFCVFPEGRITQDGKIQEAKGGISYMAHSYQCVIVPVGISGVFGMSPRDFFTRKRKITVSFGKPIIPGDLYKSISQPHEPGKSVWKAEAQYIMGKVGELILS